MPGNVCLWLKFSVHHVLQAQELGFSALSFDLKNGYDFSKKSVRDHASKLLYENLPELLVVCPTCTYEGGWHNLNEQYLDPQEALQKRLQSRLFIRFACKLFEQQVSLGKRAIFEHPQEPELGRMKKWSGC